MRRRSRPRNNCGFDSLKKNRNLQGEGARDEGNLIYLAGNTKDVQWRSPEKSPQLWFGKRKLIHAVVAEGDKTLKMSGYPAISEKGVLGKGDMGLQTT